jgi:hypothetical protein
MPDEAPPLPPAGPRADGPAGKPPVNLRRRIIKVAGFNGTTVVVIAALASLASLLLGDLVGAGIGIGIIASGVMELIGRNALRKWDLDGAGRWLPRSQIWLLALVTVYALSRLFSFDTGYVRDEVLPSLADTMGAAGVDFSAALAGAGLSRDQLVAYAHQVFYLFWGLVILGNWLYQGVLWRFYVRNLRKVTVEPVMPDHRPSDR